MVGLLMVGSSWDFPPWISFRMGGVHDSRCLVAQKGGGGGRERGETPLFSLSNLPNLPWAANGWAFNGWCRSVL